MTEFYGEIPRSPIVFAACDFNYFKEHAPSLVYSCNDVGKDVHIHITEPDQDTFNIANILNTDTDVRCTFSYNSKENMGRGQRTYYACLRFLVLPLLLQHAKKVMTVDVDCLLMKDFDWPEKPAGFFPREPIPGTTGWEQAGTRVAAGAVYMDERAIPLANAVVERIKEGPFEWFLDQIALSEAFARVNEFQLERFDEQFMDWKFKEGTTIWTGKGDRKFNDPVYVQKKKEFNRLPTATTRCWT
tara:strand:+ start:114 stop:845 length:732 start_codon:yes stop_codon:yes gene_type:complete